MNFAFARAHQDSETHKKMSGLQTIRTTARIQFTTHVQVQSIIIHNQIQCTHSVSSSQVSLYGPPLNQLCQDDLPRTSNIPLYQSQVPFSGFHLLNHAKMTYTSTMKCPAQLPSSSTISPPKDLRCPQCVQSTLLSFLGRLQHYLQVPMSSHELGNLSIILNIP